MRLDNRPPAAYRILRKQRGTNMFARLTTLSFRADKFEEGVKLFKKSVVPAARAQEGFQAIYLLVDREAGRCIAMTLWKDRDAAAANEQNRYYQDQLVKFLPFYTSPPIREGFDVAVKP
jgi:quinol monooxygenase YgiN